MAYELTKRNGTTLVDLADGIVDTTSASIKLVGRYVVNYGEIQNENFLHLLENFASNLSPANPLSGQLWFDSAVGRIKLFDGAYWKQSPTMTYASTATSLVSGDLWFNTENNELYIKTASSFTLIGPNSSATSAQRLETPRTINGVSFDGSSDITVTSVTPSLIIAGDYLVGNDFNGATQTIWTVDVGSINTASPLKVVARDSAGDIWYTVGHGVASSTKYADLAEKYLADREYDTGTVISIGGQSEVTQSSDGDRAIGVVSSAPGYMMNSELKNGTYIAIKGRVPVKVNGHVRKGDRLVASNEGRAIPAVNGSTNVFAIALEDSNGKDILEAVIL